MKVGVPTEIKPDENRVALVPAGVQALVQAGHTVLIQQGAGLGSGIADAEFAAAGARLVPDAAAVFGEAEMVVKVKEPLPEEFPLLREGQVLFGYLHLAADKRLTQGLLNQGVVGLAYETIMLPNRTLPLLTPMSEVAGRLAVQMGTRCLERRSGGRGLLLGGVPGVLPARVVVMGGGVVGTQAAKMAAGLGADVTIMDISLERLRYLADIFGHSAKTLAATVHAVAWAVAEADLVIGSVLVPGAAAPKLVTRAMVETMLTPPSQWAGWCTTA